MTQKKNKYTILLETECSALHSASIMTLRGSQCLSQMFNMNIYFLNQPDVLPVLRQKRVDGTWELAQRNAVFLIEGELSRIFHVDEYCSTSEII